MAIKIPMSCQKLLIEQGLVPPHCQKLELLLSASGPMVMRYEIFVTSDHLDKLSVVFQALASESKAEQDGVA